MGENLNTVADLKRALADFPDDLVIEVYEENGAARAASLLHVVPNKEELKDGSYEVLMICHDTLPTHGRTP